MRKTSAAKWLAAVGSLLVFHLSAYAADPLLDQARKLIAAKHPDQAYAILAPLQSERAGEPDYDYLLGVAALDSGKAPESVFAFERFLTLNPDNGPARLELARAYYEMGDIQASREEFESVQKQQRIPKLADQAIQNYLSAINKIIADTEGTKVQGYVEGGIGHDSNANSATSSTEIAIPDLGIGTLDPGSVRKGDGFSFFGGGVSVRHPFSAEWALNASADLAQRNYDDLGQYDLGSLDGAIGLTRTLGVEQYTGAFQYQKIDLDNSSYRQTYGALGQWQHSISDQQQFTVYGQAMQLDYSGSQDIRDVDRYLAGAAYSQAFGGNYLPVAYGGLYAGMERPTSSGVPQLGNDFAGVRVGGQLSLNAKTLVVANASFENRSYRGEEPGFERDRADRQMDLGLALLFIPAPEWVIRPEITYTRNHSNIVLDDFSRTQYLVTVRRNFN